MFDWLRPHRALREISDGLWDDALARHAFIAQRDPSDLTLLRKMCGEFLATKEFHGAQGFTITDQVALAIALQAVLPVLHLGLSWYDDFVGIVVHRDEVVAKRVVADDDGVVHEYDDVLAGEAMDGGPVMLSWRDVDAADLSAKDGYNVVIHEFAHKIDMRDGAPDGCPPLRSRAQRTAWQQVMEAEFEKFREKVIVAERFGGEPPWLDAYGAQAIDEFFAVACEAYFVNRARFASEFPPLRVLFDGFFGPPTT